MKILKINCQDYLSFKCKIYLSILTKYINYYKIDMYKEGELL